MRKISLCACLLLAALAVAGTQRMSGADFAVVASPDVPVTNLSMVDLRKLFLGDRQFWAPNLRVSLLVRAPVARERAIVVWTVCKMSESQFGQHWIGKVMRADCTTSPRLFPSNQAAIDLVRNMPGAVAIVNAAQVPKGMKVLSVDGKQPGEAGYKLQIAE
jgi:hypothetical protein